MRTSRTTVTTWHYFLPPHLACTGQISEWFRCGGNKRILNRKILLWLYCCICCEGCKVSLNLPSVRVANLVTISDLKQTPHRGRLLLGVKEKWEYCACHPEDLLSPVKRTKGQRQILPLLRGIFQETVKGSAFSYIYFSKEGR